MRDVLNCIKVLWALKISKKDYFDIKTILFALKRFDTSALFVIFRYLIKKFYERRINDNLSTTSLTLNSTLISPFGGFSCQLVVFLSLVEQVRGPLQVILQLQDVCRRVDAMTLPLCIVSAV